MQLLKLPLYDFYKNLWNGDGYDVFDVEIYWISVFITLLIVFGVVVLIAAIYNSIYDAIDKKRSTIETLSGVLVDRRYMGEQTTTGSGTVVMPNSNGGVGVGVVSTTSHSDEKFMFFIKADKVYKAEVDMQQFYNFNIGDKVRFEVKIGGLSKEELSIEVL